MQLVREELIELHRQKEEEIKKKEAKLVEIGAEKDKAEHYARELEAKLEQERKQREALRKELEELKEEWKRERETHERERKIRNFVIRWGIMLLLFLLALATSISWIAQKFWELNWGSLVLGTYSVAFIAWIWIVNRKGVQNEVIKQWSAFMWLHRFRNRLFIILGGILIGILANALWDLIKNIWQR